MDGVLFPQNDRCEEDPEHVIAVSLERRARLVLVFRFLEQELERALFEFARRPRA